MTFRIVTSSWFTPLPPDHLRIGISRSAPRGGLSGYRMYKKLAPGPWFKTVTPDEYRRLFFEGLEQLDPEKVVEDLQSLAGDRVATLCCFEAPHKLDEWCHRGYVSAWLLDTLDLSVPEFGMESHGIGWAHPKIPEQHRQQAPMPADAASQVA